MTVSITAVAMRLHGIRGSHPEVEHPAIRWRSRVLIIGSFKEQLGFPVKDSSGL